MDSKIYRKVHVRQLDAADCGVACLAAVHRLFGGYVPLEQLREVSGTSQRGTSLLGLRRAARELGFEAEGYRADMESLKKCEVPVVLHIDSTGLQHYIVCYGFDGQRERFTISDPAEPNPRQLTETEIQDRWKSGTLLKLIPTERIEQRVQVRQAKWRWVTGLVEEDLNLLITAGIIGLFVAILGLSTAIFSQKLLDRIIPEDDMTTLWLGLALLTILLFARTGLGYVRQMFILRQGFAFNNRVMDFFLGRLLQLPKLFFDKRKIGELTARMNDTRRIQRTIAAVISGAMIDLLLVLVSTAAIFYYDWRLGVIAILWIPIFVLIAGTYHQSILDGQRGVMQTYARSEGVFMDTMLGIGAVKTYNRQTLFQRIGLQIYGGFQEKVLLLGNTSMRFNAMAEIAGSAFVVAVLGMSAYAVILGSLTTGAMIAVLQLVGLLMGSAQALVIANIQLQEGRVAFDRMYDFAALPPEATSVDDKVSQSIPEGFGCLSISNLSFRYPGEPRLLSDLNLKVKSGEWIAVLGESGCGKSTLLNILQRFYDYESGSVTLDGTSIKQLSLTQWRSILGVVPQEIKIFNGTLLYNILLATEVSDPDEVNEFLNRYGFDRAFAKIPGGVSALVGEEGINLSGGQRQLLALARALYHRPRLLLLDEPTAALDRNTETFVLTLLERLKHEGVALIVLSHRLRTARAADRIYIIENGTIANAGQHDFLASGDNLYGRAWRDLVET